MAILCPDDILHGEIIDWRYIAWRYIAGDICWRYFAGDISSVNHKYSVLYINIELFNDFHLLVVNNTANVTHIDFLNLWEENDNILLK